MSSTPDYRAVPLAEAANSPLELLPKPRPAAGPLSLRGLPFELGPPECCLVHLGGQDAATVIEVPIRLHVRHLVFAHMLRTSRLHEGDPPGRPVADLAAIYEDGTESTHTIRERFEVAAVPATGWGELPFLALPDHPDRPPKDRWQGPFGQAGSRQTEVSQAWPRWFYLWAWANPRPDVGIECLRLTSRGPDYVIGSLVAGFADEFPFPRDGMRALRVTLTGKTERERDWRVEVDRGYATLPYRLSPSSAEQFLADPLAGFGDVAGDGLSPAYVEVSATPSATVSVRAGDKELGSARWGDLLARSSAEPDGVRIEVIDSGRNWVRVTVVDDATGQPVPCRVHFRTPQGMPFQPHGHHPQINGGMGTWHVDIGGDLKLGSISYAYIDGRCEGWLPRGDVLVDVARGFEYEPLRSRVRIEPGQQDLELRLTRHMDMSARRWFSGDTHVHFLSTQGAQLEARGEDLNVVNLLLSQWGHLFTNTEEFRGEPLVSRDGRTIVYASQENRQHLLGHLTLLGLQRQVAPWCSDGPSEAELGGTLEATMADWADRCHAQGGTVVIPHLPNPNGEPAALIATGRADAVEMLRHDPYYHLEYYRYLNGGYRLPLVGGTDKMSSDVPVGLYRTYVHVPEDEEFSYQSWCRNLTAGRTFLSGGPLLSFSVEGAMIGDTVRVPGSGGTVEVAAEASSIFPIQSLQIVERGKVVAETGSATGTRRLHLHERIRVDGDSWLAARVAGPAYTATPHRDVWERGIMAHTSPIYIACGERWGLADPATAQYMLTLVDGSLAYIRELSLQHAHGSVTHHHGEPDHMAYLERPFLEARRALEQRLSTT